MPLFEFQSCRASRRVLASGPIVSKFSFCNSLLVVKSNRFPKIAVKFARLDNLPTNNSLTHSFLSMDQCQAKLTHLSENFPTDTLSISNSNNILEAVQFLSSGSLRIEPPENPGRSPRFNSNNLLYCWETLSPPSRLPWSAPTTLIRLFQWMRRTRTWTRTRRRKIFIHARRKNKQPERGRRRPRIQWH